MLNIERKDTLLPIVLAEISQKSGLKFRLDKDFNNLKLSAFAKNLAATELLTHIADTLGLVGEMSGDIYTFKRGPELRPSVYREFLGAQFQSSRTRIDSKLLALANFTAAPFQSYSPVSGRADEDAPPEAWARKRITERQYYAAGLAYRRSLSDKRWSAGVHLRGIFEEQGFPFVVAPNPLGNVGNAFFYGYIDRNSEAIEGTAIVISGLYGTGELRIVPIAGEEGSEDPWLDRPYRYPRIPKELEKLELSKLVKKWETRLGDFPKSILSKTTDPEPDELATDDQPEYYDGRFSLGDKIENFYRRTGIPIVSTSFRTPAIGKQHPDLAKAGDLLADLADKEDCFLRFDDGFVEVRHPAYWFFRDTEPPENLILALEDVAKKRALTIYEYARLARFLDNSTPTNDGSSFPVSSGRLVNHLRGLLLRFDGEPLADAYPVLFTFACLRQDVQRSLVEQGIELDAPSNRAAWETGDWRLTHTVWAGALYSASMTGLVVPTPFLAEEAIRDPAASIFRVGRSLRVSQTGPGSYDFIILNKGALVARYHIAIRAAG